jgi:hypothetical protein
MIFFSKGWLDQTIIYRYPVDITEFLQPETVNFEHVNTLTCAVLILIICFRYLRQFC